MRRGYAQIIALGGILAAIALVFMCLGGLIPLATFVCPMLCTITGYIVFRCCGRRIAWAWYGVVAFLSVLLAPDKESAAVYVFLGYYPNIRQYLSKYKLAWIGKLVFFNASVGIMYALLIYLFGMEQLLEENMELGAIGLAVMVLLGNVTFFLLDRLLRILDKKYTSRQ